MNCRQASRCLSLSLDGALAPRRQARLAEHLAECAGCRALEQAWREQGRLLRHSTPAQAPTPEAAWMDVQRALRAARPSPAADARGSWAGWLWQPAAALAVLAAVGLALYMARPRPARVLAAAPRAPARVEYVETSLPGASPVVFEDADAGLTVIWVMTADQQEKQSAGS